MNKTRLKKVLSTVSNVVLYTFLIVCTLTLLFTIFSKKDSDGAVGIFGYQMRLVTSGSMEKCEQTDVSEYKIKSIPLNAMVFIELAPTDTEELDKWYDSLEVGDVLTFKYVYTKQVTITHRVSAIEEKADGYAISLIGDNVNESGGQMTQTIDTTIEGNPNYIIGKVVAVSPAIGVFTTFLKKPIGMILVVMLPSLLLMIREIIKIVSGVSAERRRREDEERESTERELEELRTRLRELENQNEAE